MKKKIYFRTGLYKLMNASFGAVKCMDASKKSLEFIFFSFSLNIMLKTSFP